MGSDECSGDLLPPSPPAEKATARQNEPATAKEGSVASLRLDDAARRRPHERHIRPRIQQPAQLRKPPRYRSCLSDQPLKIMRPISDDGEINLWS
jgi:hypothetical protein